MSRSYVWYTFPDMPEQEPVNVFQSRFEGWLDDGSSSLVGMEQPAAPPVFSTPGGKQYRIGEDYEARTTDGEIIVNVHIEDVTEDAVFYSVPEAPDMAQIQLPRGDFDKLMDDGRFTPVQPEAELSPEPEQETPPVSYNLTQESGPYAPQNEADPAPEGRSTGVAETSEIRDFTPYHVGDTVYLEDTAYEITAVGHLNVQLRDPAQSYPIYRSESREQFERLLYRDQRNTPITDFLAADLDKTSGYLRDALTGDGGLLELGHKERIAGLLRSGEGNARVASYLAASFGGITKEMPLPSGYTGNLRADILALDLRVNDQNGPVSISRTSWDNIAPMLRAMYQQERGGFSHTPVISQHPALPEETVRFLLQETLVGGSGMLELEDKERIANWIRRGDSDEGIAARLKLTFSDLSGTLVASDNTGIEYAATDRGITLKLSGPMVGEINYPWANLVPYFRGWYQQEQFGFLHEPANAELTYHEETTVFYPGEKNGLPFDMEIRTLHFDEAEHDPPAPTPPTPAPAAENFRITDDHLGEGGPKAKFRANMDAINLLHELEFEGRAATKEEQEILSRYQSERIE